MPFFFGLAKFETNGAMATVPSSLPWVPEPVPLRNNAGRARYCGLGARPWFQNTISSNMQCEHVGGFLCQPGTDSSGLNGRSLSAPRNSGSGWNTPMNSPRPAISPVPSLQLPIDRELRGPLVRCSSSLSPMSSSTRVYSGHRELPEGPAIPLQQTAGTNHRFPLNALSSMARNVNEHHLSRREPLAKSAETLPNSARTNHEARLAKEGHLPSNLSDYIIYANKTLKENACVQTAAGIGTMDASPKNSVWKRYFAQNEDKLDEIPRGRASFRGKVAESHEKSQCSFWSGAPNSADPKDLAWTPTDRSMMERQGFETKPEQELNEAQGDLRDVVGKFGTPVVPQVVQVAGGDRFGSCTGNSEAQDPLRTALMPSNVCEEFAPQPVMQETRSSIESEMEDLNQSNPGCRSSSDPKLELVEPGQPVSMNAFVPDAEKFQAIETSTANVQAAAKNISLKFLHELRSFRQPPAVIRQVVEAALTLFGVKTVWPTGRRHLDSSFLQKLKSFGPVEAANCPSAHVHQFLELLDAPAFTDQSLHDKCPGAAPLAQWCLAAAALLLHLKVSDASSKLSNRSHMWKQVERPRGGRGKHQERKKNKEPEDKENKETTTPDLGGLFVNPHLWALSLDELKQVENLVIGREGVGQVTFHGKTDCRDLIENLSQILSILPGEIVLYPDATLKPEVGEGLNKPATIVLYGCMPKCRTRLTDPRAQQRYKQRVAEMTLEKGAVFEDYDPNIGTWKFRVPHF